MKIRYVTTEEYIQEQKDQLEKERRYLKVVPSDKAEEHCLKVIKEYEDYIKHLESGGSIGTFQFKYLGGGSVA